MSIPTREMLELRTFEQILDRTDPADPHQNQFEIQDPAVNPQMDTPEITVAFKDEFTTLKNLSDFSDEHVEEMLMRRLKNPNALVDTFIDLDTAPNYVDFVKNSIKNMIAEENEFNDGLGQQIIEKLNL